MPRKSTAAPAAAAAAAPAAKRASARVKAQPAKEEEPLKAASKRTKTATAKEEEKEEGKQQDAQPKVAKGRGSKKAEQTETPKAAKGKATKQTKAAIATAAAADDAEAETPKAKPTKATKAKAKQDEEEQAVVAKPARGSKKRPAASAKNDDDDQAEEKPAKKKVNVASPTVVAAVPKPTSAPVAVNIPVDQYYSGRANGSVHEDFDCMLNQTNIGANNNKFYKIQVIRNGGSYVCFTRWGRVGEPGATKEQAFGSVEPAIKAFEAKFKDKTKNRWEDRASFVKHDGLYQLVHIDHSQDAAKAAALAAARAEARGDKTEEAEVETEPSSLDPELQHFIKLIFNKEMFNASMSDLKVDVTRLPLGALTKQQIKDGNEVLEELMNELDGQARQSVLERLSSRYYTLIPTAVGRNRPPTLNTKEMVQQKFDLLAVLGDIESAQDMQKKASTKKAAQTTKKPNPIDQLYASLEASMELVDPKSPEFQYISKYAANTGGRKILNVFAVDRSSEQGKPFFDDLKNRKLLWHGTNAAVVAAIIKSGLRIMPHSGGRVGRGIYLAAENSKSSGYVWPAPSGGKRIGMMFLAEAALGKEHHILRDDHTLRAPPKGFDSVVAQGWTDPDPSKDIQVDIDGRKVTVPQGAPVRREQYSTSTFSQSEYLLYNEGQHRLRYVIMFQW